MVLAKVQGKGHADVFGPSEFLPHNLSLSFRASSTGCVVRSHHGCGT